MLLSENLKQRLQSTFLFLFSSFKILMATLLTVFVHQECPQADLSINECSIVDNFTNLTNYNLACLIINFITLGIFIGFYILEFYRENIYIKYLDTDPKLPNLNLKNEIVAYPKIEKKLIKLNNHYHIYSFVLLISNIINSIVSIILLVKYYGGIKTITGYLSSIFLITDKIYNSLHISIKSVKETLPYSAYMTDHIIFNTIDKFYKIRKSSKRNLNITNALPNAPTPISIDTFNLSNI